MPISWRADNTAHHNESLRKGPQMKTKRDAEATELNPLAEFKAMLKSLDFTDADICKYQLAIRLRYVGDRAGLDRAFQEVPGELFLARRRRYTRA